MQIVQNRPNADDILNIIPKISVSNFPFTSSKKGSSVEEKMLYRVRETNRDIEPSSTLKNRQNVRSHAHFHLESSTTDYLQVKAKEINTCKYLCVFISLALALYVLLCTFEISLIPQKRSHGTVAGYPNLILPLKKGLPSCHKDPKWSQVDTTLEMDQTVQKHNPKVLTFHANSLSAQKTTFELLLESLWLESLLKPGQDIFAYKDVSVLPQKRVFAKPMPATPLSQYTFDLNEMLITEIYRINNDFMEPESNQLKFEDASNVGPVTFPSSSLHFELLFNRNRIQKLRHSTEGHESGKTTTSSSEITHKRMSVKQQWPVVSNGVDSIQCDPFVFAKTDTHLLLVNRFPIGNYSGLFTPYFWQKLPQVLTKELLHVGLQFNAMFLSQSHKGTFRVGFNSLGAMASVNHFHFQFWKIDTGLLPVETLHKTPIPTANKQHLQIFTFNDNVYPIRTLIYPIVTGNRTLETLWHCVKFLIESDIPHNLMISRQFVYLFVRNEQQLTSNYPIFYGFSDVSGWITVLNEQMFDHLLTFEMLYQDMQQRISVQPSKWDFVYSNCVGQF
ncbi:hypothetical protein RFI_07185 [Reticulomyxa filosa]|uniref:GDP-D-glucose phosphorylase 1 n=1 Tax=Reticulomyxa filosa TaxID=46433 RepID=X6NVT4_RETFI|nr:hypothetical protein RFI_07185 [Reticulomyxa filosa]|eukprot:ETO29934.1 hypothetical protein RFI_07185 [Reticulomyxa filosa]